MPAEKVAKATMPVDRGVDQKGTITVTTFYRWPVHFSSTIYIYFNLSVYTGKVPDIMGGCLCNSFT